MAALSNYLEDELLDHSLGTSSYVSPATVYVALYTTDPTDADTGAEVSGNGYARQVATFSAASGGATSNTNEITFTASGGDWGTITHIGIRDALTAGNLLYHGALTAARTVNDGETARFAIGDIDIALA